MKQLLTLIAISFALSVSAKNYYISNSGSDAAAGNTIATAWQTIAKINASWSSIGAGDSILFKRGEVFYGSLVIGKSGTSASAIVISAYGTGAKPVISGFTALTNWASSGNGVWQATATNIKSTVNLVTINGLPQQIGRYPNSDAANGGYLTYESFNGATSITDNQLTSATVWTGAEVVMKKEGYILERAVITAHSGSTITYTEKPSINPRNGDTWTWHSQTPTAAGFGYFIQNDPRTLDKLGEWYFDNATKTMKIYFGGADPGSYNVKVSTLDTLINIGNYTNIKVNNVALEGSNLAAIFTKDASNITIQNCDINGSGAKGIFFWNTPNTLVENCTVNYALCNGIDITGRYAANVTVRGCAIKNIATIAGMGSFWDEVDMKAIYVAVSNTGLIELNRIDTVGYIGIHFQGNDMTIQKNYVNYHDFVKDDGGGIYTYATTHTNRLVQDNIILNGIGSPQGNANPTHAEGIYMDGGAKGVIIKNNTIAYMSDRALYLNDPKSITITSNTCFSNGWSGNSNGTGGLGIQKHFNDSISNFTVKNNIFYSLYSYQGNFTYFNYGLNSTAAPVAANIQTALQMLGTIDSNYYNTSKTAGFSYAYQQVRDGSYTFPPAATFETWKTLTGHDAHSKRPAKLVAADSVKFVYNATNAAVTNTLDANYVGVDGAAYNGSITLQPFASAILLKSGSLAIPTVDAGNDVVVTLPIDSTVVAGTVTGTIVSYEWTKTAGPTQFLIVNPTSRTTVIDNLSAGRYTFRLKVTNSAGVSAIDSVHIIASGILPVTLLSFNGTHTTTANELTWKTTSEINSSYYSIERSANGRDFINIGRVASHNSVMDNKYGFTDNLPLKGNNYYRLVMVDRDGTTTYSRTILITTKGIKSFTVDNMLLSATNGTIKMGVNSDEKQDLNYVIVDAVGRVLLTKTIVLQKGFNQLSNEVPSIRTGVYFVKLFTTADTETKTILAQ